jgi:hypothetical protein
VKAKETDWKEMLWRIWKYRGGCARGYDRVGRSGQGRRWLPVVAHNIQPQPTAASYVKECSGSARWPPQQPNSSVGASAVGKSICGNDRTTTAADAQNQENRETMSRAKGKGLFSSNGL